MRFHCLFEQSGTFKNIFKSYGHEAYDYDILNDYRQTDFQIDLFQEIMNEYDNICGRGQKQTIFTNMKPKTDFIMAFFPCTYFSKINELNFKLEQLKGSKPALKNITSVIQRAKDRAHFFEIWLKFCFICQELGLQTIIENPSDLLGKTYLELYSPYRPSFREADRSNFGDKFVKPTSFYSINFKMSEQFNMFYDKVYKTEYVINGKGKRAAYKPNSKERSEITPRYADNFYKRFIEHQINSKF